MLSAVGRKHPVARCWQHHRRAARLGWLGSFAFCCLLATDHVAAQTCPANLPAPVAPDSRYVVNEPVAGEFVVIDNDTGLMWKQCPEGLSGSTCSTLPSQRTATP